MTVRIINADVLDGLAQIEPESVQCCVTSPPYWGLRDYGHAGQIGLEHTPEEYVAKLVAVFAGVRRVLKPDGVLWLNLGDSYARSPGRGVKFQKGSDLTYLTNRQADEGNRGPEILEGLKEKDLVGIPWRVAFALQAAGWWLRSDIIWAKPNPMPESVTDRPTKSHEYIFLLTKSAKYFYDADAIAEPAIADHAAGNGFDGRQGGSAHLPMSGGIGSKKKEGVTAFRGQAAIRPRGKHSTTDPQSSGRRITEGVAAARAAGGSHDSPFGETRNARSVWEIATRPFAEAHFATFPEELSERCIKAGSRRGDLVLDPFMGAGTVGVSCGNLGREFVGVELNPKYVEMARRKIEGPLFAAVNQE